MSLNYVSDNSGEPIEVQIPIEDWKRIKNKYPDIDEMDNNLPEWQKEVINKRLEAIRKNPASIRPIEELLDELNKEEDENAIIRQATLKKPGLM